MRRATAVGLIGLALVLLSARPASAQYDWIKWIQQLSGPGPFELQGVTVTFGCVAGRKVPPVVTSDNPPIYRYLFCDAANNWKSVTRFYAVTFATGDGENNLTFPASVPKLERVSASIYLGTGAFRLHEAIDLGTSAGFMRFSGTPDKAVTKFVIVPYAGVRPFTVFKGSNKALDYIKRGFEVKGGLIIFPQSFKLSDFGAIDGPDFNEYVEASLFYGFRFTVVF
jgi:hypothetical protein